MKIISANYSSEFKIQLKFNDGTEGEVDLKNDIEKYKDTKFYTLSDVENFKKFHINLNFDLEWYNGWDYCKDTLYMIIKGVNIENEKEVCEFLKKHRLAI